MIWPNEVHAWYELTDNLDGSAIDAALSVLSPEERWRHDKFRFARDRRDYAAAHALLRTSLSQYADVPPHAWIFDRDERGKPKLADRYAPGNVLTFSLSHARGIVGCAVSSGSDVGIDVECTDSTIDWLPVARQCFTPAEILHLERSCVGDRAARFAELWTLKEAHAKATGVGFSDAASTFGFELNDERLQFIPLIPPTIIDAREWQFGMFAPAPAYRMAIAVACREAGAPTITVRAKGERTQKPVLINR